MNSSCAMRACDKEVDRWRGYGCFGVVQRSSIADFGRAVAFVAFDVMQEGHWLSIHNYSITICCMADQHIDLS
jgi:hypothetical protein